eukprot:scaffold107700_cov11-Prasinocladus_malaysianus.AAC.1
MAPWGSLEQAIRRICECVYVSSRRTSGQVPHGNCLAEKDVKDLCPPRQHERIDTVMTPRMVLMLPDLPH